MQMLIGAGMFGGLIAVLSLGVPIAFALLFVALVSLFITGGGWHDYKALTPLLTTKLAELVNAEFTVNWEEATLKDPHLGDGYDADAERMAALEWQSTFESLVDGSLC